MAIMPCHIFHSGISKTKLNDFHGILKPMAKQLHQRESNDWIESVRIEGTFNVSFEAQMTFDISMFFFSYTLYTMSFHLTILRIANATFVGCAAILNKNRVLFTFVVLCTPNVQCSKWQTFLSGKTCMILAPFIVYRTNAIDSTTM